MEPLSTGDIEAVRRQFPVCREYIYLDHAGVAPVSDRVSDALCAYAREASARGGFAYPEWAERIVCVRRECARLINAEPEEIAFVKNTSHGLSLVAEGLDWQAGDNLLYCEGEFPSNIYPWLRLASRGVAVRAVPKRSGRIDVRDIADRMDGRTRLFAVSSVQFADGFRLDLDRTGRLCRERNVLLCVDAIQSLGVIPMDVRAAQVDFLAADAHKWLLGPEGIGVFFCRKELAGRVRPPLLGWKSVQRELDFDHPELRLKDTALRFEEGSLNLAGIFGLGAAVDMLLEWGMERIERRVLDLGEIVVRLAEKRGFEVMTPKERGERGGQVTFRGGFDPDAIRERLRRRKIMVNARGGGIRVSPHFYNTEEEIGELFLALDRIIG